jgi:hypothetical protein
VTSLTRLVQVTCDLVKNGVDDRWIVFVMSETTELSEYQELGEGQCTLSFRMNDNLSREKRVSATAKLEAPGGVG